MNYQDVFKTLFLNDVDHSLLIFLLIPYSLYAASFAINYVPFELKYTPEDDLAKIAVEVLKSIEFILENYKLNHSNFMFIKSLKTQFSSLQLAQGNDLNRRIDEASEIKSNFYSIIKFVKPTYPLIRTFSPFRFDVPTLNKPGQSQFESVTSNLLKWIIDISINDKTVDESNIIPGIFTRFSDNDKSLLLKSESYLTNYDISIEIVNLFNTRFSSPEPFRARVITYHYHSCDTTPSRHVQRLNQDQTTHDLTTISPCNLRLEIEARALFLTPVKESPEHTALSIIPNRFDSDHVDKTHIIKFNPIDFFPIATSPPEDHIPKWMNGLTIKLNPECLSVLIFEHASNSSHSQENYGLAHPVQPEIDEFINSTMMDTLLPIDLLTTIKQLKADTQT